MKHFALTISAASLCLFLTACGGKKDSKPEPGSAGIVVPVAAPNLEVSENFIAIADDGNKRYVVNHPDQLSKAIQSKVEGFETMAFPNAAPNGRTLVFRSENNERFQALVKNYNQTLGVKFDPNTGTTAGLLAAAPTTPATPPTTPTITEATPTAAPVPTVPSPNLTTPAIPPGIAAVTPPLAPVVPVPVTPPLTPTPAAVPPTAPSPTPPTVASTLTSPTPPTPPTPPALVPVPPSIPTPPATTTTATTPATTTAAKPSDFFFTLEKNGNQFVVGERSSITPVLREGRFATYKSFPGAGAKGNTLVFEDNADGSMLPRLVTTYNQRFGTTLDPAKASAAPLQTAVPAPATTPAPPAVATTPPPATPPPATSTPAASTPAPPATPPSTPPSNPPTTANATPTPTPPTVVPPTVVPPTVVPPTVTPPTITPQTVTPPTVTPPSAVATPGPGIMPKPATPETPATIPATTATPPAASDTFLLLNKNNNRLIVGNKANVVSAYRTGTLPMSKTFIGAGPKGENLVFETNEDGSMLTRLVAKYNATYKANLNPAAATDGPPPAVVAPTPKTDPAPTTVPTPNPTPGLTPNPATPTTAPTANDPTAATGLNVLADTIAKRNIDKSKTDWRVKLRKFPAVTFDPDSDYFWILETNKGTVRVKFMPEVAPNHVSNFLYLSQLGYFDTLSLHRIIPGFVAQGGCPLGRGNAGPGYQFDGEFDPAVKHDRPGLLSMANRGPGTDGSQFFITYTASPNLDGKHTIFGEVVAGMDVMKIIEAAGSPSGTTTEPITINKASVTTAKK